MLTELIVIVICLGMMLVAFFCSLGWMFARSDVRVAEARSVRQDQQIARLHARIATLERRLISR